VLRSLSLKVWPSTYLTSHATVPHPLLRGLQKVSEKKTETFFSKIQGKENAPAHTSSTATGQKLWTVLRTENPNFPCI